MTFSIPTCSTTGFPVTAYPPPTQDVGTVDLFQGTKGRGYASHGMHTDLRAWYAQQLAIVEAELMRERAAMQQKMQADYELQLRNVHFQLEEMKLKRLEELQLKREIRLRDEMEYRAKVGKYVFR